MNKLSAMWFLGILVFFSGLTPVSAGTGDLQVTCEPGVRVFIDNSFKGVSEESEGGLFISDLTPGAHALKVVKKGFDAYEGGVVIKEFEAVEVKVKFNKPAEKIIQLSPESGEVTAKVGILELRSAPMGAAVFIDGEEKSGKTDMRIENIRVGEHEISFKRESQRLSGAFTIAPDEPLVLKADFKNGAILNISLLKKNELKKDRNRLEENDRKQLKPAEEGQPQIKTEPGPPQVKTEGQGRQQTKGEEKGKQTEQQVIIPEAAKPYGELSLEVAVTREALSPPYRDYLFLKFPDKSVSQDDLLDPHFLNSDRESGDGVRYLSDDPAGRALSLLIISSPRQTPGRELKGKTINTIVKEGNYNLQVSRKRWELTFLTDIKMPHKEASENIAIKRGHKLHVKFQYTIDKSDTFHYAIERSYEALSKNFYENVSSLLKK
jgi:hypothetical protein